ncbi:hypothetical protein [Burkholderia territorii]|uniref:hypothetical protein n=1 Tax=Burkholderia territorii TaxID=1503055 RepID=UPI000758A38C|nr:hypothetical protein [Burkholderia territorii]
MRIKVLTLAFTFIGGVLAVSGMQAHLDFIGRIGLSHDMQAVAGLILVVFGFSAHLLSSGELVP